MKPKERDELLVRLDERTNNIWRSTEAQEQHLAKINNHLDDHSKRIVIVETKVEERTVSRVSKKAKVGYGGGVLAIATLLFYAGQAFGWW